MLIIYSTFIFVFYKFAYAYLTTRKDATGGVFELMTFVYAASALVGVILGPIVRGKETKSVEFGAKAGNIQIDGISFIEHLSFRLSTRVYALRTASVCSRSS